MSSQLLENPKKRLAALVQEGQKTLHFEKITVKGYEKVLKVTDPSVGLTAIIAFHSTALGPTLGGIRIQPYATFEAALEDALRLSRGMFEKIENILFIQLSLSFELLKPLNKSINIRQPFLT